MNSSIYSIRCHIGCALKERLERDKIGSKRRGKGKKCLLCNFSPPPSLFFWARPTWRQKVEFPAFLPDRQLGRLSWNGSSAGSRLATSHAQSGRKRNQMRSARGSARSVRLSLEVRVKRSTTGEHDLFRLQEIESSDVTLARNFLLLSWACVSTGSLVDENELFLALCEFLRWFDTFITAFETELLVRYQSINLTRSFKQTRIYSNNVNHISRPMNKQH